MKSYFQEKTVLLTGAAGFIGSHLADELIKLGSKVIGVDNLITGRKKNIEHLRQNKNFTFIEADVAQTPEGYLPKNTQLDLVLHFASPASPPGYQKHPVETYLVNSIATHNLCQLLLKDNPSARLVFASTSEIYGDPLKHPQKESYWGNVNPNGARSCYDESKRLGETICGVHQRDLGLDTRIVRIFNTYGPRINPEDGRVIPDFIKQGLQKKPFTIHGDGKQTRSFCYIDDLVAVILKFAAADAAGMSGETINIGNPDERTVLETASVISQLVNDKEPQFEFKPMPLDDPSRRQPDIGKAKKLLDWEPQVSFADGLEKTIDHFRKFEFSSL